MRYIGVIIKSVICVLAIVGAVALYISNPFGPSDQARISAVRSDLIQIQVALKLYYIDNGNFPTEEQGLYALVEKPVIYPIPIHYSKGGYLEKLRRDPWGENYHYKLISSSATNEALIWSFEENVDGGTMKSIVANMANQSVQHTAKDASTD